MEKWGSFIMQFNTVQKIYRLPNEIINEAQDCHYMHASLNLMYRQLRILKAHKAHKVPQEPIQRKKRSITGFLGQEAFIDVPTIKQIDLGSTKDYTQ